MKFRYGKKCNCGRAVTCNVFDCPDAKYDKSVYPDGYKPPTPPIHSDPAGKKYEKILACNRCWKKAKEGKIEGDYCDRYFNEVDGPEIGGFVCRGEIIPNVRPMPSTPQIGRVYSEDEVIAFAKYLYCYDTGSDICMHDSEVAGILKFFNFDKDKKP